MGRTYYLSPHGHDRASGTSPEQAWRSLDHVNAQVLAPGDSLLLAGGETFAGSLHLTTARCGDEANPLYIGSYGEGRATIRSHQQHAIWLDNCAGLVLDNLALRYSAGSANPPPSGVFIHSTQKGADSALAGIWMRRLDVQGFPGGGITLLVDSGRIGFRAVHVADVVAAHNEDHGILLQGDYHHGPSSLLDVSIKHCLAHDNPGLPNKTWSHTGNGIVVGNATRVDISHCEAHHNGAQNHHRGGGPVGIWLWNCHQGRIANCHSHHNATGSEADGGGFDLDGGCQACVLEHNYSHHNAGAGYLLAAFDGSPPLQNCHIRHNLSYNDGRANDYGGMTLWRGRARLNRVWIYHNVVIQDTKGAGKPSGLRCLSGGIDSVYILNNLFAVGHGVPWLSVPTLGNSWQVAGNAWVSLDGSGKGQWGRATLDQLQLPAVLPGNWAGKQTLPPESQWKKWYHQADTPWQSDSVELSEVPPIEW